MGTILLTGATGQVGGELCERLPRAGPRDRVVALVRAASDDAARARLAAGGAPAGVVALCGDLERPRLGLAEAAYDALAGDLVEVVHCAAATRFDLPLAEARRVNAGGTAAVLALAARAAALRQGALRRVRHVSTAYVGTANAYERSKAEAEDLVRASGLPFTIYRPSVIVGRARDGLSRTFQVLYFPMALAWRELLPALPYRPGAAIDVVPVDWVAERIVADVAAGAADGVADAVVPLVSGEPIPVSALVPLLGAALDRARAARELPPVRRPVLVGPGEARFGRLASYLPYLTTVRERFEPAGEPPAPPLASYLDRVVAYATTCEFVAGDGSPGLTEMVNLRGSSRRGGLRFTETVNLGGGAADASAGEAAA